MAVRAYTYRICRSRRPGLPFIKAEFRRGLTFRGVLYFGRSFNFFEAAFFGASISSGRVKRRGGGLVIRQIRYLQDDTEQMEYQ